MLGNYLIPYFLVIGLLNLVESQQVRPLPSKTKLEKFAERNEFFS